MREAGKQVDRFWVNRFVERNAEKLACRQAAFLDADRHNANPDEIRTYFDCCKDQLKTIPSILVWAVDETRVGAAKKQQDSNVIVSSQIGRGPLRVPEIRIDSGHSRKNVSDCRSPTAPSL
jgi:hypothetical protein